MSVHSGMSLLGYNKMASKTSCTVVVVGDAKIGKTALIRRLTEDVFTERYTPTGFDKVLTVLEVNKHNVEFVLWDTSGSPAYDSVRSLSYQEADVFLVCYKISDPISLYNVKNKWITEIRRHAASPHVPVVLCGCQQDTRLDQEAIAQLAKLGRAPVSQEQALAICCEIEAINYVETSAKYPVERETQEAFELCALAALKNGRPGMRRTSSTTTSSSHRNLVNISFGSNDSGSAKRNSLSASSSLKKSLNNISFSGSEAENVLSTVTPIMEDDDVFPSQLRCPPLSPRFNDCRRRTNRTSLGSNEGHNGQVVSRNEHHQFGPPLHTSTTKASNRLSAVILSEATSPVAAPQEPSKAQVRPSGLSRRTSFRSQQQKGSIPVATPKSPLGSVSSYEAKPGSQPLRESNGMEKRKVVGFESLKSHSSTASHGSTGSKTSTGSSVVSSVSSKGTVPLHSAANPLGLLMDPDVPDTEDPQLLNQLQFVSPKNGVFRPVNPAVSSKNKKKQNCAVM